MKNKQRNNKKKQQMLKKIGLRVSEELYKKDKSVEWLAFEIGMARSTLREIIAGRSNPRILSLNSIARGLGYKTVCDFLCNDL